MTETETKMASLRSRFAERARTDMESLAIALDQLDRPCIHQIAHGLHGTGTMFGYPVISAIAGQIENAIDSRASHQELEHLTKQLQGAISELQSQNTATAST